MTDAPTWEQALDALESHLRHAEAVVGGEAPDVPAGEWVKPHGLGPMPAHLVDRAMALRVRQASLVAAIPAVLAENRKQRQMAGRMDTAPGRRLESVYVDVSA